MNLSPNNATPAHHTPHAGHPDELAGIETTAQRIGLTLMPWQREAVAVATQHNGTGYLHPVVVCSVPRQSGKSTLLKAVVMHRLTTGGLSGHWEAALLAQSRHDAARFVTDWALEAGEPLELKTFMGIGNERLHHGPNQIRPYAPTPTAMHSRSLNALLWDEAWSVDYERGREILQAAVPAMATRPDRQTWFVSTAGTSQSKFLREWVEQGRDGTEGVCLIEYAAPAGADIDDLAGWAAWHPAYGKTQDARGVRQARGLLFKDDEAGFRRAYANQWPEAHDTHGAIHPDDWNATQTEAPPLPEDGATLGVDVDPYALSASIAASWRDPGGTLRVELVDHREGVSWILPRLTGLINTHRIREVWAQDYGPVAATLDTLRRERIPVQNIVSKDASAATQALLTAIRDRQLTHHGQPALTASALAIGTRPYGDGVQWRRRDAGTTSPITAVGWAHWGVIRRKQRVRPRIVVASA